MLDWDSGLLKNSLSFGLEAFQMLTSRTGYVLEQIISEELIERWSGYHKKITLPNRQFSSSNNCLSSEVIFRIH